jgi:hypothetical protein
MKITRYTDKLRRTITQYYQERGYEYVRWNILYANKKAKKSYSSYLQQALRENWAEEWKEEEEYRLCLEEKNRFEEEKRLEEERRKKQAATTAEELKPIFKEKVSGLGFSVTDDLWEKAEKSVPSGNISPKMAASIHYCELLVNYLNENGENFPKEVVAGFGFMKEIVALREKG